MRAMLIFSLLRETEVIKEVGRRRGVVAKPLQVCQQALKVPGESAHYQLAGIFHENNLGPQQLHIARDPADEMVARVVAKVVVGLCP